MSSIRDSQLFTTDPDIGLDIDNPEALENFYQLLMAILRIVNSVVLTKGSKNNQILAQGRAFLVENRQCMQAIFKAATRSDRLSVKSRSCLNDLVDNFTVLISATAFIDVSQIAQTELPPANLYKFDEQPAAPRAAGYVFT